MDNEGFLNLNGHLLRVFLAIFETNSVTKAADMLGCSQSTISYSLDKLRTCLDDQLFVKSGRSIVASERAIALAPNIRAQLAGLESLSSIERYLPEQETKPITIATNANEFLPQCQKLLDLVRQQAPKVPVKFISLGPREDMNVKLESGGVDVAVVARLSQIPSEINTKPLMQDRRVCFFDPEERGAVRSLDKYCEASHAILDFGGNTKSAIDVFLESKGRQRHIQVYAPDVQSLAGLVKGTEMVMTMHSNLKQSVFSEFEYCDSPVPFPDFIVDMHWHKQFENSPRNVWLRNLVAAAFTRASLGQSES